MRLFDLAQLMGVSIKRPIQYLGHNLPIDPDVYRRYSELLKIADHPAFHGGEWTLIEPRAVAADDSTYKNILTCQLW